MANCNYKVHMKDIQNKYKFKIFCTGNGTLTDYYTKNETDTLLNAKVGFTDYATNSTGGVIKTNSQYNTNVDGGSLYTPTKTYEQYQSMTNGAFVGKGTLENVITGKGLVDSSKIVNATSTTAGETYDVRYINTMIGDIETILTTLDVGSGV